MSEKPMLFSGPMVRAILEGRKSMTRPMWRDYSTPDSEPAWCADDPVTSFRTLWDSINGKRPGCAWEANPWVWAVSFQKIGG